MKKFLFILLFMTSSALANQVNDNLKINLQLVDGNKNFTNPLNIASQNVEIDNIRMYISNVALINQDGSETLIPGLQLTKIDTKTTNMANIFTAKAPIGDYKGIRFDVGVPRELNHKDATHAQSPLSIEDGMYWAWNSGYIFFSLAGKVGENKITNHIGSDNLRATISFADLQKPYRISVGEDTNINVKLDLQKLYKKGTNNEDWNFMNKKYAQVHFGAEAEQLFLNLKDSFSQ